MILITSNLRPRYLISETNTALVYAVSRSAASGGSPSGSQVVERWSPSAGFRVQGTASGLNAPIEMKFF